MATLLLRLVCVLLVPRVLGVFELSITMLLAVRTGAVDLVLTLPQDGELTVSVDLLNDEPPHRAGARACAELTSAGVLLDAVAADACASV